MANKKKRDSERSSGSARAAGLSLYYKIITIYTIICAVAYGALRLAQQKGYQFINTTIQYWVWYALVIGVILLVGKYITNIPKKESTRRGVRISVAIVTICTIFATFVSLVSRIDNDFRKYAELASPDGARHVIVMRADMKIPKTDTEPEKVLTAYRAYERLNRFFCKTDPMNIDIIILQDDPDARLDYEWTDAGLNLTTNGNVTEGMGSIELIFQ